MTPMAELVVCGLEDLPEAVASTAPSQVVSILGDKDFPELAGREHLRLRFHDIDEAQEGLTIPGEAAIRELLDFAAAWPREQPMVIHCLLGVSRSPAAALAILSQLNPGREADCVRALATVAPRVRPNRAVLALADGVLGCEGRLVTAARELGDGPYLGLPGVFRLAATLDKPS